MEGEQATTRHELASMPTDMADGQGTNGVPQGDNGAEQGGSSARGACRCGRLS